MPKKRSAIFLEVRRNFKELNRGLLYIIILFAISFLSFLAALSVNDGIYRFNLLGNIAHDVAFYRYYEGVTGFYALFFTILSAFSIASDFEAGHIAVSRSMGIPTGKIIIGKALFFYLFLLITIVIGFVVGFAILHDNTTVVMNKSYLLSYIILMLSFSIIGLMFIFMGLFIGTVFSKKINSVVVSLATILTIEAVSSMFNGQTTVLSKNFYTITYFQGSLQRLILHVLDPAAFRSFIPIILNFYSNIYINPNCATSNNAPQYAAKLLFPPGEIWYYFTGIFIYIAILVSLIFLTLKIKRRYY